MKKKIIIVVAFCLFLSVLFIIKDKFIGYLVRIKFPQREISAEEFIDGGSLKDCYISDGFIVAESFDPWIYIEYNRYNVCNPKTIDVNIEYAEEASMLMYYVFSHELQEVYIKNDNIHADLIYSQNGDSGLRLDWTATEGKKIKINSIVINNWGILKDKYVDFVNVLLFFSLILCIGIVIIYTCIKYVASNHGVKKNSNIILLAVIIGAVVSFLMGILVLTYILFSCLIALWCTFYTQYNNKIWTKVIASIMSVCVACVIIYNSANYKAFFVDFNKTFFWKNVIILILLSLIWYTVGQYFQKKFNIKNNTSIKIKKIMPSITFQSAIWIILAYSAMEAILIKYLSALSEVQYKNYILHLLDKEIFYFNCVFFICFYGLIYSLLGKLWGSILFVNLMALLSFGNIIKIHFQGGLIKIADIYLMGELFGIASQYVDMKLIIGAMVLFITVILLCIIFYKKKKGSLRPDLKITSLVFLFFFVILACMVKYNGLTKIGLDFNKKVVGDEKCVQQYGLMTYYYVMATDGLKMNEPDGYDETLTEKVDYYKIQTDDMIKPNVILILAESYSDVEKLPNVEFSEDLYKNTRDYMSYIVTPSYGGRTAAAEFESLTGLSNYFIQGGVIAYTNYIKNPNHPTGSLAWEFKNSEYNVVAMHPNAADYYNRNIVYKSMGFDVFLSEEYFASSQENFLKDGLLKDEAFFDLLIQQLEQSEQPIFIFGATIEGHSPYNNKFGDGEVYIKATSDIYEHSELIELEAYAQTIYDLDVQLGRLFDYLNQSNKPTLVYVYGDHLPPLSIYNNMDYINSFNNKYYTPLIVYSNYKDLSVDSEYSLSYLPAQILHDAGIEHRSYYDFLYALKSEYPIIHNEYPIVVNDKLKTYEQIQYDILFGKQYLLK